MIRFLRGTDLWRHPLTAEKMFRDRNIQFSTRHGWEVSVDENGFEIDIYDGHNPIYVISYDDTNPHRGSMRLLPLTGPTMTIQHFGSTIPPSIQEQSELWESTRFCICAKSNPRAAIEVFAGGALFMLDHGIKGMIATFEKPMLRIYRAISAPPVVLGSENLNGIEIYSGFWEFSPTNLSRLVERSGA